LRAAQQICYKIFRHQTGVGPRVTSGGTRANVIPIVEVFKNAIHYRLQDFAHTISTLSKVIPRAPQRGSTPRVAQWSFRQTTMGTLASQVETGVWVQTPSGWGRVARPTAEVRGYYP